VLNDINSYLYAVQKLDAIEVERLIKFISKVEKEIIKQINSGLLNAQSLAYMKQKVNEAEKLTNALMIESSKWVKEMTNTMYLSGVKFASLAIGVEPLFTKFDVQAMNVLAGNLYQKFADVSTVVGRRIDDVYRAVALENLKGQISGYTSVWDTAKNIRNDLAQRGITGFVDRAGKNWDMESYTNMVARTSTAEVFRQGTANTYMQRDIDLVQILPDEEGSINSCEICQRWAGKIISLTGKTEGYPTLQDAIDDGVFHPNCIHNYHALRPTLKELVKERKELEAKYYGTPIEKNRVVIKKTDTLATKGEGSTYTLFGRETDTDKMQDYLGRYGIEVSHEDAKSMALGVGKYTTVGSSIIKSVEETETEEGFKILNRVFKAWAKGIEKFLHIAPRYEGTLYRGIRLEKIGSSDVINSFLNLNVGNTMLTPSVTSFSISKGVACARLSFLENEPYFNILIKIPNSKKGIPIAALSTFKSEQEVLIAKNTNLKILKKYFTTINRAKILVLEVKEVP